MDAYRDAFIAMTFFAVLFFIILLVILILWCKGRRQTEVKTVVIEPKRRPISTRPAKPKENGGNHADVNTDLEAGVITADEIELSDDTEETAKISAEPEVRPVESEPEDIEEQPTGETVTMVTTEVENKGLENPTFQADDDDDVQTPKNNEDKNKVSVET